MVVTIDYSEGAFRVEEGEKDFTLYGTTRKRKLRRIARSIVGGKGPEYRWRYEALRDVHSTLQGHHA